MLNCYHCKFIITPFKKLTAGQIITNIYIPVVDCNSMGVITKIVDSATFVYTVFHVIWDLPIKF